MPHPISSKTCKSAKSVFFVNFLDPHHIELRLKSCLYPFLNLNLHSSCKAKNHLQQVCKQLFVCFNLCFQGFPRLLQMTNMEPFFFFKDLFIFLCLGECLWLVNLSFKINLLTIFVKRLIIARAQRYLILFLWINIHFEKVTDINLTVFAPLK